MLSYADLHIHSRYSRATSRDADLEHLALWARKKGLAVVATGDFTHPAWFEELKDKLVPAQPGLFQLKPELDAEVERQVPVSCRTPVRFTLSVEISTIYKRDGQTRKVHHLVYMPDLDTADRFRKRLGTVGNLASDGRPIMGLDSRNLLEMVLESGPGAYLVPAHIWTPWFAALGSKSGFDSIDVCYADLASHVFAVETGLSSDPPMNWRVSSLDRFRLVSNSDAHSPPMLGREACVFDTDMDFFAMRAALETGKGYGGTVEFFPEEGKYHLDGHRACNVCMEPTQTRQCKGICPTCGKPLTIGVMHRVEALADRPEGSVSSTASPFKSLVPLAEIVGEISGVGAKSGGVESQVATLTEKLGPELRVLQQLPVEDIRRVGNPLLAEAIDRVRRGQVIRHGGYDGEYGVIRVFAPGEVEQKKSGPLLIADVETVAPRAKPTRKKSRPSADVPSLFDQVDKPAPVVTPPSAPQPSTILGGLDPEQRAAASVITGPVVIVAGPGTGKTRTLTHRMAHLLLDHHVPPNEILAVTFTRRAAEEMRTRLDTLVPQASLQVMVTTFHGLGLQIIKEQHRALGLPPEVRILDQQERLALTADMVVGTLKEERLLEALSRCRHGNPESDPAVVEASARYEQRLREQGAVDLDDLLLLPVRVLEKDAALVEHYRKRFRHVCVDEFQDIDPLQYRLVRLLVPPDGNLCVIGDPDQAIYSFRGADVGFFLKFGEDYPGARTVHLTANYRCGEAIVRGAMQVVAPGSLVKDRRLVAVGTHPAAPRIFIHQAPTDKAEAEFVVHTMERMIGGWSFFSMDSGRSITGAGLELSFSDFAVLYRTDAQSGLLMEALQRSGIPFQKRTHDALMERPGVRAVVEALRKAQHGASVSQLLQKVATESKDMASAVEVLLPLAERHGDHMHAFMASLALGAEVDTWDPRADRVSLLTLHAAKGLEFPVVFMVGVEDGLLPLRFGGSCSNVEEERRLMFVGMTRARSHLFLAHARRRMAHGKTGESVLSPFMAALDQGLLEPLQPTPPSRAAGARQMQLL